MKNVDRTENPEIAEIADEFNRELNNLSTKSFGGQTIVNIELPVGQEVEIPHSLKVTPKYRIILRQSANAVITDGDTAWDDKKIYLKAIAPASGSASVDWEADSVPTTVSSSGKPYKVGSTVVAPLRRSTAHAQTNINSWARDNWSGAPHYFFFGAEGVVLPTAVNINFSGATSVDTVIVSILLLKE